MGPEGNAEDRMTTSEYLAQLLKDKKQLQAFPNAFMHLERILDDEIRRVRGSVFSVLCTEPLSLPEPLGPVVTLCEKLSIPTKDFPDFNFIGRLLGPRGMTAKKLELETGCKILVRGQGSMRDKLKEEQMKGKPKWEHLNEELHVLITVEDSRNRATIKLRRAIEEVKKLLVPVPESEDELKKHQLIELAILNGTYKGLNGIFVSAATAAAAAASASPYGPNFLTPSLSIGPQVTMGPPLTMGQHMAVAPVMLPVKSPDQAGAPILLAPLSMTMFAGALTPLPSPGPVTPVTTFQSPGIIGSTTSPLFIQSDGSLIYQFDPCVVQPHPSPPYDYSASAVQATSFGLPTGH